MHARQPLTATPDHRAAVADAKPAVRGDPIGMRRDSGALVGMVGALTAVVLVAVTAFGSIGTHRAPIPDSRLTTSANELSAAAWQSAKTGK